jgi:prepilin-type N-terminal cleavage/methylation domain-containing protein
MRAPWTSPPRSTARSAGAEAGFTLIELVVATAVLLILLPATTAGVSATVKFLVRVTSQSATQNTASRTMTTLTMQINGAQPVGYCPTAPGAAVDPALELTTPASDCSNVSQGPPAGIAWNGFVPSPPGASCPAPEVGQSSLFAATSTCVGFFSYDYTGSITNVSLNAPLTPPEVVWVWVDPTGGVYISYYQPTGSATYTSPAWASTPLRRFVATVASPSVFTYYDAAAAVMTAPISLGAVTTVGIDGQFTFDKTGTVGEHIRVVVSGNVYQSQAQWDATT